MTISARLRRGGATLDLMTAPYTTDKLIPPGASRAWQVAEGSAANQRGGELVGSKLLDSTFSFSVRVMTTTSTEAARAAANRLVAFCDTSGAGADALWLDYKPNADLPEPLWGQFGAYLRYEVIHCDAVLDERYLRGRSGTGTAFFVDVTVRVKPAVGQRQRLANASGAVLVDRMVDGRDHGLRVMQTVTNKMTQPIFAETFALNNWTVANGFILETANTDYILNGYSAVLITPSNVAGATYTRSINAGNTNTHAFKAYVRRPDGAAVDANDCQIYYNAALTTTFTALRGGWYLLTASAAGINAATDTGLLVKSAHSVYLSGFVMGESALPVEFIHGDMLGCAWSGARMDTTTTATSGALKLTAAHDSMRSACGAIAITWKPEEANTLTGNRYLFSFGAGLLAGYYNATDDKFYLTDGTNTVSSAAQTFAATDTLHLVFCWGAGGLNIYKNGASIASGASYAPAVVSALNIGSDQTPANRCRGALLGVTIYETELTAAQALAVYTAATPTISAGLMVDNIPYLWSLDGDGVADNCIDTSGSTGAPHAAYTVMDSIPGSLPAGLDVYGSITGGFGTGNRGGLYLSMLDVMPYADARHLYMDCSSGGGSGLTYSGGAYGRSTVSTGGYVDRFNPTRALVFMLAGRDVCAIARIGNDATGNLKIGLLLEILGTTQTAYRPVTIGAAFVNRITDRLTFPDLRDPDTAEWGFSSSAYVKFNAMRTSGSGALDIDFFQLLPRPILALSSSSSTSYTGFRYNSMTRSAKNVDGAQISTADLIMAGDMIEPYPGRSNILYSYIGSDKSTYAVAIGDITTYARIYVTPRWSLL